jgi:hypothetical protein
MELILQSLSASGSSRNEDILPRFKLCSEKKLLLQTVWRRDLNSNSRYPFAHGPESLTSAPPNGAPRNVLCAQGANLISIGIEGPGVGSSKHSVELWARLPGSPYSQVDVFGSDFPAAAGGIFSQLGKLHLGVLVVEGRDAGVDRDTLAGLLEGNGADCTFTASCGMGFPRKAFCF